MPVTPAASTLAGKLMLVRTSALSPHGLQPFHRKRGEARRVQLEPGEADLGHEESWGGLKPLAIRNQGGS